MKKAHLYCPYETTFFNELLVYKPVLPGTELKPNARTSKIEVFVLGIFGEQALVHLPQMVRQENKETALVNLNYLSLAA
ncbi:hypothetical protein GW932_02205 [archaeon]|nr:hypothetical protein [archaeon]